MTCHLSTPGGKTELEKEEERAEEQPTISLTGITMLKNFELLCSTSGRVTLGLYFFGPGALLKITNMDGTSAYMAEQGMVFIYFFLILTIAIQLFGGGSWSIDSKLANSK